MLIIFERHDIIFCNEVAEITLYCNPVDYEFGKEIFGKHFPNNKDITESIAEYIRVNMPEIKKAVVRVVSGSVLICSVGLSDIHNALAMEITDAAIEQAKQNSPAITIWIDEKKETFEHHPLLMDDVIYLPLREVCEKLGAGLEWNDEEKIITIRGNTSTIQFQVGEETAFKDGLIIDMPKSFITDSITMIPLRFLSEAMGYYVEWENESKSVYITQQKLVPEKKAITKYGEQPEKQDVLGGYQEEDLYWLSRLVHAESQSESYEGKLAVANVILNRVKSEEFPNSVKDVIFDTRNGVQFVPTKNGMLYKMPSEESIRAAKAALVGQDNSKGTLYFVNPSKATNRWIMNNRKWGFVIGNHHFYH